jgi:prepilin-type N-terminal cleavage/methylation domain-containing protein
MLTKLKSFMNKKLVKNQKRQGFTLVELMVSMAIVILLGGASFFAYGHVQQMRKMAQVSTEMDAIASACLTYESLNVEGELPASLADLETGLDKDHSIDGVAHKNLIQGSTVKTTGTGDTAKSGINDPWGNAYGYSNTDRTISCTPKNSDNSDGTTITKHI